MNTIACDEQCEVKMRCPRSCSLFVRSWLDGIGVCHWNPGLHTGGPKSGSPFVLKRTITDRSTPSSFLREAPSSLF